MKEPLGHAHTTEVEGNGARRPWPVRRAAPRPALSSRHRCRPPARGRQSVLSSAVAPRNDRAASSSPLSNDERGPMISSAASENDARLAASRRAEVPTIRVALTPCRSISSRYSRKTVRRALGRLGPNYPGTVDAFPKPCHPGKPDYGLALGVADQQPGRQRAAIDRRVVTHCPATAGNWPGPRSGQWANCSATQRPTGSSPPTRYQA